jgi:DNA-binding GntR family transcriptional regulator
VSRFTVREAIRVLAGSGLVRRKPRAGTVVTALPDDTRYRHSIGSLRDLVQYAQTTDFQYVYVGRIELTKIMARLLSARAGQEWIYAMALRREVGGGKPLGLTRLYLNPALKGIERALRGAHAPVLFDHRARLRAAHRPRRAGDQRHRPRRARRHQPRRCRPAARGCRSGAATSMSRAA